MVEVEEGMIEPYSERLVERKFSSYAEVSAYLYPDDSRHQAEREMPDNT